jgi:murein endopeptidase
MLIQGLLSFVLVHLSAAPASTPAVSSATAAQGASLPGTAERAQALPRVTAHPTPPPDMALLPLVGPGKPSASAGDERTVRGEDTSSSPVAAGVRGDSEDVDVDGGVSPPGDEGEGDAEEVEDGVEDDAEILDIKSPITAGFLYSNDITEEQLKELWEKHPEQLGSLSVGFTEAGSQLNAHAFPTTGGPWTVINPAEAWGAKETIEAVMAAARMVAERSPGGPPLRVNDISRKDGGWLRPHKSHQSGRDVDLGLFYPEGAKCSRAREKCMDIARNWQLVRALIITGDVQMILVDKRIQAVLYSYALAHGEDKVWLDSLFHSGPDALIKHARRHRDHFHVRYYAPRSQELGRRVLPLLASRPENNWLVHRIRSGDSLGRIAAKYGTTVNALKKANGMKNTLLRAGRSLRVPLRGPCTSCPVPPPVVVPPRRLPPELLQADRPTPVTLLTRPREAIILAARTPGSIPR